MLVGSTVPCGQHSFLFPRFDSACVSRPSSETCQSRPSQVKRQRWPAPSKYTCPSVAGLQDWAASPTSLWGQQESNLGFQLVELQCYHWAKYEWYVAHLYHNNFGEWNSYIFFIFLLLCVCKEWPPLSSILAISAYVIVKNGLPCPLSWLYQPLG